MTVTTTIDRDTNTVEADVLYPLEAERRARLDYITVADAETLEKIDKLDDRPTLVALAAYVGKTRLIDNMILNKVKKKDGAGPQ